MGRWVIPAPHFHSGDDVVKFIGWSYILFVAWLLIFETLKAIEPIRY